jgi:hypothetical protein
VTTSSAAPLQDSSEELRDANHESHALTASPTLWLPDASGKDSNTDHNDDRNDDHNERAADFRERLDMLGEPLRFITEHDDQLRKRLGLPPEIGPQWPGQWAKARDIKT